MRFSPRPAMARSRRLSGRVSHTPNASASRPASTIAPSTWLPTDARPASSCACNAALRSSSLRRTASAIWSLRRSSVRKRASSASSRCGTRAFGPSSSSLIGGTCASHCVASSGGRPWRRISSSRWMASSEACVNPRSSDGSSSTMYWRALRSIATRRSPSWRASVVSSSALAVATRLCAITRSSVNRPPSDAAASRPAISRKAASRVCLKDRRSGLFKPVEGAWASAHCHACGGYGSLDGRAAGRRALFDTRRDTNKRRGRACGS